MNLFGMVTTAASRDYTPVALRSLFAHTPADQLHHVVLIDNDGDFALPPDVPADRITLVRNAAPLGFAQNGNQLLARARALGADLFFLNNDLVFTEGWLTPLLADRKALLSPMSNAQAAYKIAAFTTAPAMDLAEYLGHDADVEVIAAEHRARHEGYTVASGIAFFCIKIPKRVYDVVGDFDERFGKGGGEDRDYTIRAWIAGIPTEFARASWVLHFQGRSTWRDAETPEQRCERERQYLQAFEVKWGPALAYAFLRDDWNLFRSDAKLAKLIERREFTGAVRQLRSVRSLDAFVARQRNAKFAAVCVIYEDDSWLAPTIESVYDACDSLWFLVGEAPWNGEPIDQSGLIARLEALPDPAAKVRIVRGRWPDEATQRNEGLRLVAEAGADYCFVLDADEIYDPVQLEKAMTLVRANPRVDCWRLSCFTYWKSPRYRIDPPEAYALTAFVRPGAGYFTENRMFAAEREVSVPMATVAFHHMSYARTDAQILRKIMTFGHAKDVVPGWFENVWRKWDQDHSLQNLNPCWPGAYHRAVEQPYGALPAALQRLWEEPAGA